MLTVSKNVTFSLSEVRKGQKIGLYETVDLVFFQIDDGHWWMGLVHVPHILPCLCDMTGDRSVCDQARP